MPLQRVALLPTLVTVAWFVLVTNMSTAELVIDSTFTSRMALSSQLPLHCLHLQAPQDQPQHPLKLLPPSAFLWDGTMTDATLKESMAAHSTISNRIARPIQLKTVSTPVLDLATVLPDWNLEHNASVTIISTTEQHRPLPQTVIWLVPVM